MTFHSPSVWFLFFLLIIPFIWWRWTQTKYKTGVTYTSAVDLSLLPSTFRSQTAWVPSLLRLLALTLLIVCIARPQKRFERTQQSADGVAIELVIDRSSSMMAHDFTIDGNAVDRLTAVRKVAGDFIQGMGSLDGRSGDLIGLVTFAGFADSNCPMTFDHEFLVTDVLNGVKIVTERGEDGTAIGDAIALAVERLSSLDERIKSDSGNSIQSKVIILLTDGENTAGDIDPQTAADIAAALDITVYTIGAGTNGLAPYPTVDLFGRKTMRNQPVVIDEETLEGIAETTGGKYFRATDTESLEKIYAAINEMERTEITQRTYVNHVDMAVKSVYIAGFIVPPLLIVAFAFLLCDVILRSTYYRILD
ncbi:MAG: VWA domain-containing protein [Phycisphaerales bacterium]|nr:VWA domain-containing protein [Planctomycetota bacterium]MBL6997952.1 VWA domain-containing protein [Phycisphaerales bacterium]